MRRSGIIRLALLPIKNIHSTQLFVNDLKPIALQNVLDHGNSNSQAEVIAHLLLPTNTDLFQLNVCNPHALVEVFTKTHENYYSILQYRDKAIATFECT